MDGSNFEALSLTAGEDIEELSLAQGDAFDAGSHVALQMVLVTLNGVDTLFFTLKDVPKLLQVDASGGAVTVAQTFDRYYCWHLTHMARPGEQALVVTHNNGNIYRIDLADFSKTTLVSKAQLTDFFGVDSNATPKFFDIDYEPASDTVYCYAGIWWNFDVPSTIMAISPDGSSVTKLVDGIEMTQALAGIRTPERSDRLDINAITVNPDAAAEKQSSLFLGDYWSGLMMVRMDLPKTAHTMIKNAPTGALVDLDLGSGDHFLCFGPFGMQEGEFTESIFLPEGENPIQVIRDGVPEAYSITVSPAFNIAARCKRGKAQLTWTHQAGSVRYDIYRSTAEDPNNFSKIAETTSTYSTYLDTAVTNDVTHLYAVAAVYEDRQEFSNVIAATPSSLRRPGNFDPVIYSPPPPEQVWTDGTFSYRVLAADSNGDNLTYSLADAPDGMIIDANGLITWTPDASQTGVFTVVVTVSDGSGGVTNQTFTLNVAVPPAVVPNVVGMDQTAAESMITAAGLTVGTVTTAYSTTAAPGCVISQSLPPGDIVINGSSVEIVISLGPEPVSYSIHGHVVAVDSVRPIPLSGVSVRAEGLEIFTDDDGYFELNGLTEPVFTLFVDGWDIIGGPYAQMHFDVNILSGENIIDYVVRLPYIGPFSTVQLDEEVAELSEQPDGSVIATIKGDITVATRNEDLRADLSFKEGTQITFEPGVPQELALVYLGLTAMPEPLPADPVTGQTLQTTNIFSIQPEGITFSEDPVFVFEDRDNLPVGTSYLLYHYGSWEEQELQETPVKQEDGSVHVTSGIKKSGTHGLPPHPIDQLPSEYKTTTLTGRVVRITGEDESEVPVPNAYVWAISREGYTDENGYFSIEGILSQLPGDEKTQAVQVMAMAKIGILSRTYIGGARQNYSNPDGTTDLGTIKLGRVLKIESLDTYGHVNVHPAKLNDWVIPGITDGIKITFNQLLDSSEVDARLWLTIFSLEMPGSLYDQGLTAIPEDWDFFSGCDNFYHCADITESCEGNDYIPEDDEDLVNTFLVDISDCDCTQGDLYNRWWYLLITELEEGPIGVNGEELFVLDGTVFSPLGNNETTWLLNHGGMPPGLRLPFATREDPAAAPSPLFGLLVPDEAEPSGYKGYDYDTLDQNTIIEVETGKVLRLQAEDQTFMRRIVARFDGRTFTKTTQDNDEYPFLMHLEIPVTNEPSDDPVLLDAMAEGLIAKQLIANHSKVGHKTGLQVSIRVIPGSPVIDQIIPKQNIPVNMELSLEITGTNLGEVETVTIVDPGGNEEQAGFTIVDDTTITIEAYTFSMVGEHVIILASPDGEGEDTVMVVEQTGGQISGYCIKDLGTFYDNNDTIQAWGINNQGQVVGSVYNETRGSDAFIWQEGVTLQELADKLPDYLFYDARSINDSGQVVGSAWNPSYMPYKPRAAYIWQESEGMTNLGALGNMGAVAYDINNAGQVVGMSALSYSGHSFIWQNGIMTDMGNIGLSSSHYSSLAYNINNLGQAVGQSHFTKADGYRSTVLHACLWEDGATEAIDLTPSIGEDVYTTAFDINDNGLIIGQIKGYSSDLDTMHIWPGGTSLGKGGKLCAINNHNQIIGEYYGNEGYPFLYEDGTFYNLYDHIAGGDEWISFGVKDINDNGQIAGSAVFAASSHRHHAMVLTPIDEDLQITGQVLDAQGNPVADVTISVPGHADVTTDAAGNYHVCCIHAEGTYEIIPGKTGYTFNPASVLVTVPPAIGGRNFIAAAE